MSVAHREYVLYIGVSNLSRIKVALSPESRGLLVSQIVAALLSPTSASDGWWNFLQTGNSWFVGHQNMQHILR
jgi:hypothetical protein